MLLNWKNRIEEKRARNRAIAESKYWKTHPLLQQCLQAMRGSCTVAPMDMHEAAIAVVNIALRENSWTTLQELIDIPEDFFPDMVYLVWDDEKLPVLKAPWELTDKYLWDVRAVAYQTFLVSETLDRILWFNSDGGIKQYSIS